jgi:hypothetical protein
MFQVFEGKMLHGREIKDFRRWGSFLDFAEQLRNWFPFKLKQDYDFS